MKEIQLVGGGGLAKDIIACFQQEVLISGIWDDGLEPGSGFMGIPVLGSVATLPEGYPIPLVIAVGNPAVRKKLFIQLEEKNNTPDCLIHSRAIVFQASSVQIGQGSILMPFSYITGSASLANNCLLHMQSGIHHDVHLAAHTVLMPGAKISCAFSSSECYLLDTNGVIKT